VTAETALRLALVPAVVWLASVAARRWGHKVSGYLGGMPLIGGPITLFVAIDHGAEFAAKSAAITLAVVLGQAAHLFLFTWMGQRTRWPVALLAGWSGFAIVAIFAAWIDPSPAIALAMAVTGLAAAWRWLPRYRGDTTPPAVPPAELRLRLVAAFVLAATILYAARLLGPVVSGVLLSVPITGSIMPPFTLARYGSDSLARLARGFAVGLTGFTAFFFTLAIGVVALGIAMAFAAAVVAALATVFVAARALRIARMTQDA
jgi:hypothetical protein